MAEVGIPPTPSPSPQGGGESPPTRAALPIIDAPHHVWDLSLRAHPWLIDEPPIPFRYGDYSPIRRSYLPDDYRRDAARFNVVGTVYVEAEWDPADPVGETRWVHETAARCRLPNAMVAQAWLDRDDAAEVLAQQASFPLVRSVRHKPKAAVRREEARRGAPGSMDCPRWRAGYALLARHGFHFDLQTPWWHFAAAAELARDFPATTIIVNHTGLPADRSAEGLAGWRAALELLAAEPNLALKISGLGVPGRRWTPELQGPVVRDAIRIFGAERAMFASNFPVDQLVATFEEIFAGFLAITGDLDEPTRRKLFHDNAARIYRLQGRTP
jgi:predicted TIM-barrel fold metal-dependent hydrolase